MVTVTLASAGVYMRSVLVSLANKMVEDIRKICSINEDAADIQRRKRWAHMELTVHIVESEYESSDVTAAVASRNCTARR